MQPGEIALLAALFAVAALYAAVGHGGASGYLAVMAIAGFSPQEMRPTALALNLLVSLVGTILFFRAGAFRAKLFPPLVAASIPAAFAGGLAKIPPIGFDLLLAAALAAAALRLVLPSREETAAREPGLFPLLLAGGLIGLASGLVGVGGGIFLTPLLVLARWADVRSAAALSAPFIFLNSAAGLAGQASAGFAFDARLPPMLPAVLLGGLLGGNWGSRGARAAQLRMVLAAVLAVAVAKLMIP